MINELTPVFVGLTTIGSLIAAVWFLRGSWANEFSKQKSVFFDRMDKLEDVIRNKLDYHERHDDDRFSKVEDRFNMMGERLWQLRLDTMTRREKIDQQKEEDRAFGGSSGTQTSS